MKTPVRLRAWHSNTVEDADGRAVCYATSAGDGAHIVKCLNVRTADVRLLEALLDTLERTEDTYDGADGTPRPNTAMSILIEHGDAIRAAIQKEATT